MQGRGSRRRSRPQPKARAAPGGTTNRLQVQRDARPAIPRRGLDVLVARNGARSLASSGQWAERRSTAVRGPGSESRPVSSLCWLGTSSGPVNQLARKSDGRIKATKARRPSSATKCGGAYRARCVDFRMSCCRKASRLPPRRLLLFEPSDVQTAGAAHPAPAPAAGHRKQPARHFGSLDRLADPGEWRT